MASSLSYSTFESNQKRIFLYQKYNLNLEEKIKLLRKNLLKKAEIFLNSINEDFDDMDGW